LRGRATGLVSTGIGVGFTLSGVAVPIILSAYGAEGWRYSWYYLGIVLLAIATVDIALLRNKPEDLGLREVGTTGWNGLKRSSAASSALRWGLVYRNRAVWFVGLVYLMYGFSYIIYVTFFAAYLQTLGWIREAAISLWFIVGILSILSGFIWGWVSDILGRKYGMALAFMFLSLAYLLFATTPTTLGLYCSAILFGIAAWSIPTVAVVAAADYVGAELRSAAAGFVTFFFGVGQVIGPAVGGYVIEATQVFGYSFLIATIGSLIGAGGALALKKPKV
ncbi:TPA: MFS transporter, partial [Candidatus Bathyarchaeota archaeon]|nr:MFS transporter [Candidatus Bathyarchaeota archaeon]